MAGAENLFIAYLPLMRAQLDRMGHTLEDVIMRLDHVERTVAGHSEELAGSILSSIALTRKSHGSKNGSTSSRVEYQSS